LIGDRDPETAIPELYSRPAGKSNPLPHLFRRRCAAQRDAMQALKELQRLQKERRSAEATEETAAAPAQNGFDSKQQPARIQPVSQVPAPASKLAS
jgi:hypothetical protein